MTDVSPWPGAGWTPVPRPGVAGVHSRLLDHTDGQQLLAQLRFDVNASIDEHDAPHPIDVYCLEGRGSASVDGEPVRIEAGERVRWPAGVMHRLWTEDSTMVTLMHEHLAQDADRSSTS